jgi:hypothetical protein
VLPRVSLMRGIPILLLLSMRWFENVNAGAESCLFELRSVL